MSTTCHSGTTLNLPRTNIVKIIIWVSSKLQMLSSQMKISRKWKIMELTSIRIYSIDLIVSIDMLLLNSLKPSNEKTSLRINIKIVLSYFKKIFDHWFCSASFSYLLFTFFFNQHDLLVAFILTQENLCVFSTRCIFTHQLLNLILEFSILLMLNPNHP